VIAIPAVDLRDGACVQLVGGSFAHEKVRLEHPVEVARSWEHYGFQRLHVVDLDAAMGKGSNLAVVRAVLTDSSIAVQVGGGVRSSERVEELLEAGATRVVVGTRAIEEPEWLAELAARHPGEIIVACDVRERKVTTHGWTRTLPVDILDVVAELNPLPLAGLLVTAVHREGQMQGTDLPLMEDVAEASSFPVIASGGVATMADLRALEHRGLAAVVIGMALYTGALDPVVVAGEFCE
jgi:phosphoribosylformimino-5-aminoimidazole carboxamide ribotide isomerase